jgi:hypothetical protein
MAAGLAGRICWKGKPVSIWTDNGYTSRRDYLNTLAEEHGIARATVYNLASLLGPDEDFDGLVTTLEDYADQNPDEVDA